MKIEEKIGRNLPCFIIAEAGVNHNGDINLAHQLIDAAHKAGADAVKFQAFFADELVTDRAPKAGYQVETTGVGTQFDMLKALELSAEDQDKIKTHCEKIGIAYICTPYDLPSVEILKKVGVDAFKIASSDLNNLPLLKQVAKTGQPTILSTGMALLGEIEGSVNYVRSVQKKIWLSLLQCTAEYPSPIVDCNLRVIETLQHAFDLPVGYSDHTVGTAIAPLAVTLGAEIVEKHFTLDRKMTGPDHRASIDPSSLAELVEAIRNAEMALGDGIKRITPSESVNRDAMRKSVVIKKAISKGDIFSTEHLTSKRPGDGLAPKWINEILGNPSLKDLSVNQQVRLNYVDWDEYD